MSLQLAPAERLARARADLRVGAPVVFLGHGPDAAVVVAAETLSAPRLADLRQLGDVTLALTARRAGTLKIAAYDGDIARVSVPGDVEVDWIWASADPSLDLNYPMKGPFMSLRGDDATLHREAVDLCKLAHLLPAVVVVTLDAAEARMLADQGGLSLVRAGDFPQDDPAVELMEISSARVPLGVAENSRVRVFRPMDGGEEHYAIEIGAPDRSEPVLSRLHSACFTGDLMGSLKCDCGPQLRAALQRIGEEGSGVLLYLNQEGRGIGLANKMRAYSLQDQGFDTVESNHRLGFEDDERDFRIGASILRRLGFSSVRLMTNNPGKVDRMNDCGITVVERVPLQVGRTAYNDAYLRTKAAKSGHLL